MSPFVNTLFENSNNEILVGTDKGITIINNNFPMQLEKAPIVFCQQKNTLFNYTAISYNRSNSLKVEYNLNNLGWFYFFLNRERYFHTRGIIFGMLLYAPYMIYVNLERLF